MDTYVLKITSSRGVPLEYLTQEIEMIVNRNLEGDAQINLVPALDCIWLRSESPKLKSVLLKDNDFIVTS